MKIIYFVFINLTVVYTLKHKCNVTHDPQCNIDCSDMNLIDLPSQFETKYNVHYLIFHHNKLNSSVSFRNWTTLRYLDVSFNNINNISENIFSNLESLRFLNISYNNIDFINETAFKNIKYLEFFDMSGNPNIWKSSPPINCLRTILYNSIKKLILSSSKISFLPKNLFNESYELQYLDLSRNNLTHIPFLQKKIVYFDISYNLLESLDIDSFENASNIKDVIFDYNPNLTKIDNDLFEHMKGLRKVSFNGCKKLSYLPPNLFYFNNKLNYISLKGCNLKSLSLTYRSVFLSVKYINLDQNPWVCNSTIKWLAKVGAPSNTSGNFMCEKPINITLIEFYGPNVRYEILRRLLALLMVITVLLFGLAIYISFNIEKNKRLNLPYSPLSQKNPLNNPVYLTTVV